MMHESVVTTGSEPNPRSGRTYSWRMNAKTKAFAST